MPLCEGHSRLIKLLAVIIIFLLMYYVELHSKFCMQEFILLPCKKLYETHVNPRVIHKLRNCHPLCWVGLQ